MEDKIKGNTSKGKWGTGFSPLYTLSSHLCIIEEESEGIKALGNKRFYRTIPQFNLKIPKCQYNSNI